jgi:hypothetical protein
LEQLPQTAGLDQLVEYVKPAELDEIRNPAMARIESAPDWIAQLSAMLDGDHRLNALYILTRHLDRLPAPVLERCWSTAGSVARDQLKRLKEGSAPTETDQIMLDESVKDMGFQGAPMRERHWKEIAEVREFLEAANPKGNNVFLDSWVRTSQFERVPESAGIEPLLEFAGPSESEDIRKGALDRIGKVPDSTAKLAKFLDGPHRLDALVVLALRVDHLPEDLRERCWQAAGLTAKEMAAAIQQRNPPTPVEARKLRTLVTSIWGKLGPVQDGRLAALVTVRDVVRAVGGDYDKAEFAWADGVLDAAKPAGGPRK